MGSKVFLFIVLLLICFAVCLIMAKHADEGDMVNEHQALADIDKHIQLEELKDAVREAQKASAAEKGNCNGERHDYPAAESGQDI